MAILRMFASAREAAGTARDDVPGSTVGEVLGAARRRYGDGFADVLATCRIWVNGDPADEDAAVGAGDEIAVLPPVSGGATWTDPATLDLTELRARRRELQDLDDAVSYVRRVAQGRADLARTELARRSGAEGGRELADDLPGVLGDRLLAGSDRPPRPAEDFSEHPRAAELDQLCADHGFGRLAELEPDELMALAGALDDFERRVSTERHELFAELDALTEELVRRYRDEGVANSPEPSRE